MDVGIGSSLSTSLCFDRQDFFERKFNAERFLVKCRLSGHPFEKIRDDLRVLLRIVQNSMIELINQRYADFVNLSSNLAGLSTTISKLNVDIEDCVNDLSGVTLKISNATEILRRCNDEKLTRIKEQQNLRRKIDLYQKLSRLDAILEIVHENSAISNVFDYIPRLDYYIKRIMPVASEQKDNFELETCITCIFSKYQSILERAFIEEIKNAADQTPNSIENLRILLNCFASFQRMDAAHACFLNEFVDGELRSKFGDFKNQNLEFERLLRNLLSLYQKYTRFLGSNFVKICLLTYLLNILDEKFTNLIFSTDPTAFKQSFLVLENFTREISIGAAQGGLIRMIFRKFNVDVYYQLKKKDLLDNLNEIYAKSKDENVISDDRFNIRLSERIFDAISSIWANDGVYLPNLKSKCVELSFLILNKFLNELIDAKNSLQTANTAWRENIGRIIDLIDDLHLLRGLLNQNYFERIVQSGLIYNSIQSSLTILMRNAENILQIDVAAWIAEQITSKLDKVSEIPRRYRWTKKDAPESPSSYVRESLEYWSFAYERCSSSKNRKIDDFRAIFKIIQEKITESFAEKIRQVLNSVDKISSSLNRLKKGSAANFSKLAENGEDNSGQSLSDEDKIRLQLKLDMEEYCRLLSEYDIVVEMSFPEILSTESNSMTQS